MEERWLPDTSLLHPLPMVGTTGDPSTLPSLLVMPRDSSILTSVAAPDNIDLAAMGGAVAGDAGKTAAPAKRRQVKAACVNCRRLCKKCDEERPCQRCIRNGTTDTCVDYQRKPRAKGVKRGPYRRRSSVGLNSSNCIAGNAPAPVVGRRTASLDDDANATMPLLLGCGGVDQPDAAQYGSSVGTLDDEWFPTFSATQQQQQQHQANMSSALHHQPLQHSASLYHQPSAAAYPYATHMPFTSAAITAAPLSDYFFPNTQSHAAAFLHPNTTTTASAVSQPQQQQPLAYHSVDMNAAADQSCSSSSNAAIMSLMNISAGSNLKTPDASPILEAASASYSTSLPLHFFPNFQQPSTSAVNLRYNVNTAAYLTQPPQHQQLHQLQASSYGSSFPSSATSSPAMHMLQRSATMAVLETPPHLDNSTTSARASPVFMELPTHNATHQKTSSLSQNMPLSLGAEQDQQSHRDLSASIPGMDGNVEAWM